ncbi:MAG TPA: GIY-YIG nuclease family protein [Methanofastidiosum sp.]|nr:GIY-YIG nuclease family protein [Methanofastidiosum sp.]
MNEKRYYLYLVRDKDNTKFKVGCTFSENPRDRLRQYVSHNPDVVICGYWKVPNKKFEGYVQTELKKQWFKPCIRKGQKEWFEGSVDTYNIDSILNKLEGRSV